MANYLKVLKDVAVYINTNSFVGMAKTVSLPTIERTTAAHETLAMQGTINVGVGKEAMEATFTWEGWDAIIAKLAYNTVDVVDLQCRAVIDDMTGNTRVEVPCIVYMKGVFRSNQGGEFSAKSLATRESTLDITYFKEEIDGEVITEQDFANNIDKVGGRDLNATRNRIMGIS